MTAAEARAPAKINLALHVTGRRADGYHLLDSLVVFAADAADRLSAAPADRLGLTLSGPRAAGVPPGEENLVLRAARALARHHGIAAGAAIRLDKHLPHGAGLGGGSSDAAAVLNALCRLWTVPPLPAEAALALGADVPVCLTAPVPARMSGIGEVLAPVRGLPPLRLVLAAPGVAVETRAVFAGLGYAPGATGAAPMEPLPGGLDADGFLDWLARQRNDLEAAARALAPGIGAVLAALRALPGARLCRMSGSGGTCWAAFTDPGAAAAAARTLAAARPDWWVAATAVAASSG